MICRYFFLALLSKTTVRARFFVVVTWRESRGQIPLYFQHPVPFFFFSSWCCREKQKTLRDAWARDRNSFPHEMNKKKKVEIVVIRSKGSNMNEEPESAQRSSVNLSSLSNFGAIDWYLGPITKKKEKSWDVLENMATWTPLKCLIGYSLSMTIVCSTRGMDADVAVCTSHKINKKKQLGFLCKQLYLLASTTTVVYHAVEVDKDKVSDKG